MRALAGSRPWRYLWPIVLVLIIVRAALPSGLQWYVNRKLDASEAYDGNIGNVDLHLYRGAYSVDDVVISKTMGEVPVPLFDAQQVEFSVLWSALLRGSLVASIHFEQPNINLVDSEQEANRQTGTEGRWLTLLDDLVPLRIDEIEVNDGSVHFRNFEVDLPVDVYINQLDLHATNLTNSRDISDSLIGRITGTGRVADAGELDFTLEYDPESEQPTFDLDGRVTSVPLKALDTLIIAYAPFDVEGGEVSVAAELGARDGSLRGYVKPLITDLDVFDWHADVVEDEDNPFVVVWESLVGLVSGVLQNQEQDQIATLVEVDGNFGDPETDNWSAFVNILRNAFVEAFTLEYEDTVSLDLDGTLPQGEAAEEVGAAEEAEETEEQE